MVLFLNLQLLILIRSLIMAESVSEWITIMVGRGDQVGDHPMARAFMV